MRKPIAYVAGWIPAAALSIIQPHAIVRQWKRKAVPVPRNELLAGVARAEGLLVFLTDKVDKAVLNAGPRLRVVSNCAVGVDNIDLKTCKKRKIAVGYTPDVLTETTADLVWALLMAAARRIGEGEGEVREGKWGSWHLMYMVGHDVHDATLGIVGMGRIGEAVARRARGFNMRILYCDRDANRAAETYLGARRVDLPVLLAESDFISVHVPGTKENKGMFGASEFGAMKRTCVFVNTARGSVVDQAALTAALRAGDIAAAGLDVFEKEPLAEGHPLTELKNVVLTPHIGSASKATRTAMAKLAAENLVAGLLGKPLPAQADP
jgi:glyoxylate reductase